MGYVDLFDSRPGSKGYYVFGIHGTKQEGPSRHRVSHIDLVRTKWIEIEETPQIGPGGTSTKTYQGGCTGGHTSYTLYNSGKDGGRDPETTSGTSVKVVLRVTDHVSLI